MKTAAYQLGQSTEDKPQASLSPQHWSMLIWMIWILNYDLLPCKCVKYEDQQSNNTFILEPHLLLMQW